MVPMVMKTCNYMGIRSGKSWKVIQSYKIMAISLVTKMFVVMLSI